MATPTLAAPVLEIAPPATPSVLQPMTLAEAVGMARDRSLAAASNDEKLLASNEQRSVTAAALLPNLSYSAAATYNVLPTGSSGVGNGLSGFPAPGTYLDSSLSARQTIFDAFITRDALIVADYQIDINKLSVGQAEQDAMRDAAVDFLQVQREEGLAAVAADAVSQAQEHLRLGAAKLRAGSGTRGDVLQLEAQLSNAQAAFMQAQNAVTLARLTLANALNAPLDDRSLMANPPVPIVIVTKPGTELAGGLVRREEIREDELRVLSDRSMVDTASRAQWPQLSSSGSYSQRDLAQGNFAASLSLSWPLYTGDKPRHQMEAARHTAASDQAVLEQARQAAALDIRTQYQSQQEAIARVATTRRGLGAGQEAYHIALSRYRSGLSTLFELVDVQTTLIQARGNYVQAVIDEEQASVRLARALGQDVAGFLGAPRRTKQN